MTGKLTPKQRHFADEWLIDHNGVRAYRAAYPSIKKDHTAGAAAARLLVNVRVQAYIQARQAEMAAKYAVTQERILKEEALIAFADIRRLFRKGVLLAPDQVPEEIRRAVRSFEAIELPDGSKKIKVQFWDKGRALERISKHLGLYEKDNKQHGHVSLSEVFAALHAVDPELAEAVREQLQALVEGH